MKYSKLLFITVVGFLLATVILNYKDKVQETIYKQLDEEVTTHEALCTSNNTLLLDNGEVISFSDDNSIKIADNVILYEYANEYYLSLYSIKIFDKRIVLSYIFTILVWLCYILLIYREAFKSR